VDTAQDARPGDVDGPHRQAELAGHRGPGRAVQGQAAKGAQGARLELLLDQVEQAAEDVLVVLAVPLPVQLTLGALDLGQGRRRVAATPSR
jgi:hypothetical protein